MIAVACVAVDRHHRDHVTRVTLAVMVIREAAIPVTRVTIDHAADRDRAVATVRRAIAAILAMSVLVMCRVVMCHFHPLLLFLRCRPPRLIPL